MLTATAWIPKPACATQFGMDYWPYVDSNCWGNEFLTNQYWTAATKAKVAADLNQMCSMGLTCQRFFIFAGCAGWCINQNGPNYFDNTFAEEKTNIVEYLGMCSARGIKVDMTIGSDWLLGTDPGTGLFYWQWAYGNSDAGWTAYMADVHTFFSGFVNAIENSPYASTVQWYDISNEVFTTGPFVVKYPVYLNAIWDGGWVPAAKKGFSVLRVPPSGLTDYDHLKNGDSDSPWLGTTRSAQCKLTDSHCYPEMDSNDWNVAFKYNKARTTFPSSTTIVGEYAYSYSLSGEATQASNEITIMNNLISAGVPYAMHWMFVDRPDATNPKFAWCKNGDECQPNDVVGKVVDKLSLFTNGDFESGTSQFPTGWGGGSNGGHPLTYNRINGQDCTGNYFYRITDNYAPDNIYSLSPYTAVPACSKIYLNAYIRGGNTGNICIGIHQYDANGNWLGLTMGPTFNSAGTWQWFDYQQAVGGWVLTANPNTRYVYVGVVADTFATPGYLDTDCVSLSVR